jgi:hypothetical protein
MSSGNVDIAITYCPAAEKRVLNLGDAVERVYGYNVRLVVTPYAELILTKSFRIISSSQDPHPILQDWKTKMTFIPCSIKLSLVAPPTSL